MAFWLARERRGQDSAFIQRFDPRFWTVNFPRPMMASVVNNVPGGIRVGCEFHHRGELAGLIWDSQDTLDHPLLAYETDRDYSHTILRFRWRSNGLIPLDQPHGPTLTVEGRDAAGAPRSWFVRLWNYAVGTPEDAQVTLDFSDLQSGYVLPGEQVHPADIDRMFISLVPPGYIPGSTAALPARASGRVRLTEITCEGDRAMLEIGDVMLPPHGEQIATAYDDAFNQTPDRLLRNIRGLGYRGTILHYVGMSHFFQLAPGEERLLPVAGGALCLPADIWHRQMFLRCRELGYEVIASLSYELLADHCPGAWQQRAFDGEPTRTGWVPPSALLSPAHAAAMAWVRAVSVKFAGLLKDSGLPVRFQIGEPWWWVMGDGRPCLYDDAARTAFGGNPPEIGTMRGPLNAAQKALLDQAGAILAQSTAALTQAVRSAAGGAGAGSGTGTAEVLLLAFTPTILAADMPELKRANLPLGWAAPAFDRLQLEDYDWLTAGADALRRAAYALVDQRLGYPPEQQDYLSGFVLQAGDAESYWRRIDNGLDQAARRGISRRFIWALPQISRDGYTRLAPVQEEHMQSFDDVLYPLALGRDAGVSPEFSTNVAVTASGHERRNSLWSDARLRFDVGPGVRSDLELAILIAFFRARRGAARGFRLSDPFDFSSNAMIGTPTMLDQKLGTGNGLAASFQLVKNYGVGGDGGGDPQIRPITRPRADTLTISIDGAATSGWTLEQGGWVIFDDAPPEGSVIRAGFLFDVPVRFAEDRLDITGAAFAAGEAPSVPLIEIREAV